MPQSPTESVGARLMRLRKAIKVSRFDLATACGVSRATVSMWENDKTMMSADNLFKVANFLAVSVHELWFGEAEHAGGDAYPEFERVRIKSQEQVKMQALQWLDDLKQLISELEPRANATLRKGQQSRSSKSLRKPQPRKPRKNGG